ncbi:nicotinate-nucleotide adenylyltransferase [Acuticoccus kandeliae]|uniref:nicotinate-nucleotide adenylyltransferase n=1 Tax=Acuticoccus kandeliae TaxID=2073160 RepID=UPI001FEB4630|nr:nicotinate-nucleotide adenylyltransferase [Acuticoccus kandeliae]
MNDCHPGAFPRFVLDPSDLRVPPAAPGQSIALFGGSFNPPHSGHRNVALAGLTRLGVDQVWWMVTPGNPLKANDNLAPLAERIAATRRFADHPRMVVTACEATIGTRYTADAIAYLKRRYPAVHFIWLMGADNLAQLNRWLKWRDIVRQVPVAVVDRPGASPSVLAAPAPSAYAYARIPESRARALARAKPPAWVYLHVPLDPNSSTLLRAKSAH